ncbi:hypothetical protein [Fulvivirga lutea]|uniref:Uncharacterized protein n=1 Tax=Fulvivirga lutea TaxID=2810512 RepID=A0A974WGX1_9BACT|nr:hypothetical protein [Fulvivirga lutea]QSE96997.1 hypothetical protein JR347_15575 [Fulvivirga lutea]
MTSYNVANFRFIRINCPSCNEQYQYTNEGTGIDPDDQSIEQWSYEIYSNTEEQALLPIIAKCTNCSAFIWPEINENSEVKVFGNSQEAYQALNATKRPTWLNAPDYVQVIQNNDIDRNKIQLLLEEFWLECCASYRVTYEYEEDSTKCEWPVVDNFNILEQFVPMLDDSSDLLKFEKADVLRGLGRFTEAQKLFRQIRDSELTVAKKYLIKMCKKKIAYPVVIPKKQKGWGFLTSLFGGW